MKNFLYTLLFCSSCLASNAYAMDVIDSRETEFKAAAVRFKEVRDLVKVHKPLTVQYLENLEFLAAKDSRVALATLELLKDGCPALVSHQDILDYWNNGGTAEGNQMYECAQAKFIRATKERSRAKQPNIDTELSSHLFLEHYMLLELATRQGSRLAREEFEFLQDDCPALTSGADLYLYYVGGNTEEGAALFEKAKSFFTDSLPFTLEAFQQLEKAAKAGSRPAKWHLVAYNSDTSLKYGRNDQEKYTIRNLLQPWIEKQRYQDNPPERVIQIHAPVHF